MTNFAVSTTTGFPLKLRMKMIIAMMITTGPMVITMMTSVMTSMMTSVMTSVMTSMMTSMMALMMTIATAARTATDEEQHRGRESWVQQAQVKFDISYPLPLPHQHCLSPRPSEMSLNSCLEIGAKRCTFGSESKGFCHFFIFETVAIASSLS